MSLRDGSRQSRYHSCISLRAESQKIKEGRGINCQGLNKPAIIDALTQHDRCADHEEIQMVNNDDYNDDDIDSESVLDFPDSREC